MAQHATNGRDPTDQSMSEDVGKDVALNHGANSTPPGGLDDARNWSHPRKLHATSCAAALSFVAAFASSALSPGLNDVAKDLATSAELARFAFSVYVLGMAVGANFAAPCSETFGRIAVYRVAYPCFALFMLGTGFAKTITALIITRFFAGMFASPGLSIGSGVLADIWSPEERAVPMAAYVATPFLGPSLGPLVGSYLIDAKDWRWTSWIVLFMIIASAVPTAFLQETYKPKILSNRRKKTVQAKYGSLQDARSSRSFMSVVRVALFRPLHMYFTESVVTAFSTWIAFNFAIIYSFFAALPYIYSAYYDFSITSIGLTYLGLCLGNVLGFCYIVSVERHIYKRIALRLKQSDPDLQSTPPEHRLYAAMLGGWLIAASLFILGWTIEYHVHWIAPVVAETLLGAGVFLVFMSAMMYTMQFYGPTYGASAIGANTLLRYVVASVFPLFSVQLYEKLGAGWASSLLGFVAVVLAIIPFVLHHFSRALQTRSAYRGTS